MWIKIVYQLQLAKHSEEIPQGPNWIYETKYDGYRISAIKKGDTVKLLTRNEHDWSDHYPIITNQIRAMKGDLFLTEN